MGYGKHRTRFYIKVRDEVGLVGYLDQDGRVRSLKDARGVTFDEAQGTMTMAHHGAAAKGWTLSVIEFGVMVRS